MTCDECGAQLVAQSMPTRMRWDGTPGGGGWVSEDEAVFWVHRVGTKCHDDATPGRPQ